METNGAGSYPHRRRPSSDRHLNAITPLSSSFISNRPSVNDEELNEEDVFWTGDFTAPKRQPNSVKQKSEKSSIPLALKDDNSKVNHPGLYRTPSLSSTATPPSATRMIPASPKAHHERECARSMPLRKQSAPMDVPVFARKKTNDNLADVDISDDEEMLPPHEIVARASADKITHSVLEGYGRTLKGRDLRLVRDAVFRITGFED